MKSDVYVQNVSLDAKESRTLAFKWKSANHG